MWFWSGGIYVWINPLGIINVSCVQWQFKLSPCLVCEGDNTPHVRFCAVILFMQEERWNILFYSTDAEAIYFNASFTLTTARAIISYPKFLHCCVSDGSKWITPWWIWWDWGTARGHILNFVQCGLVPVTHFFSHAVYIGWEGNLLIAGFVPSRHSWTVSDYDTAKFLIYSISRRHLISVVLKLGDALAGACCYTVCALSNILVQSENLS